MKKNSINRFVFFVAMLFLFIHFSCTKNNKPVSNQTGFTPYPYDTLIKYKWYDYENFDTSYMAVNVVEPLTGFPLIPYYKTIPVLSNACTLNTFYSFNADHTLTRTDCNGVTQTVCTWQVSTDTPYTDGSPTAPFPLLQFTTTTAGIYTPFTDTIEETVSNEPVYFTMIDSTTINVMVTKDAFGGRISTTDSSSIFNYIAPTIFNHILRHN